MSVWENEILECCCYREGETRKENYDRKKSRDDDEGIFGGTETCSDRTEIAKGITDGQRAIPVVVRKRGCS